MRNIFLKKSYAKCVGETSHRLFSEKSKLSISLDQQSEILYSLFSLYAQVEHYHSHKKRKDSLETMTALALPEF